MKGANMGSKAYVVVVEGTGDTGLPEAHDEWRGVFAVWGPYDSVHITVAQDTLREHYATSEHTWPDDGRRLVEVTATAVELRRGRPEWPFREE